MLQIYGKSHVNMLIKIDATSGNGDQLVAFLIQAKLLPIRVLGIKPYG